jgi:protein gp37
MGKIEWTKQTWNPWWGCSKISPECGVHGGGEHGLCYAAVFAGRELHPVHKGVAKNGRWTGRFTRSGETPRCGRSVANSSKMSNRAM